MANVNIAVSITGKRPLLMHSLALLNKFNPLGKQKSALTSLKKKTEADQLKIQELEWQGSLYHDAELGPYIPSENIESMIVEGARLSKGGKNVQRGVFVTEDRIPLVYKGPRDIAKLYNNGNSDFIDVRGVRNMNARVLRCRPIFKEWSIEVPISYDDGIIKNTAELLKFIQDAGLYCGLGDYRPKFGRFEVTDCVEVV